MEYSIFDFAMPLYSVSPTLESEEPPECTGLQQGMSSFAHLLDNLECVVANKRAASSSLASGHNISIPMELTLQKPAGDKDSSKQEHKEAAKPCTAQVAALCPFELDNPEPHKGFLLHALQDPERLAPDRVDSLVALIFEMTLDAPGTAEEGAAMCLALVQAQQKCPWMRDECNFVDHVLNSCLVWFDQRIRAAAAAAHWRDFRSRRRWEAFLVFLAELLTGLAGVGGDQGPGPWAPLGGLSRLAVLLCDCGQIMPTQDALHEVLVLRNVLVKAGSTANRYAPTHVEKLMCSLRMAFEDPQYSAPARKIVLEIIELCASRWKLDADQVKYYCGP